MILINYVYQHDRTRKTCVRVPNKYYTKICFPVTTFCKTELDVNK